MITRNEKKSADIIQQWIKHKNVIVVWVIDAQSYNRTMNNDGLPELLHRWIKAFGGRKVIGVLTHMDTVLDTKRDSPLDNIFNGKIDKDSFLHLPTIWIPIISNDDVMNEEFTNENPDGASQLEQQRIETTLETIVNDKIQIRKLKIGKNDLVNFLEQELIQAIKIFLPELRQTISAKVTDFHDSYKSIKPDLALTEEGLCHRLGLMENILRKRLFEGGYCQGKFEEIGNDLYNKMKAKIPELFFKDAWEATFRHPFKRIVRDALDSYQASRGGGFDNEAFFQKSQSSIVKFYRQLTKQMVDAMCCCVYEGLCIAAFEAFSDYPSEVAEFIINILGVKIDPNLAEKLTNPNQVRNQPIEDNLEAYASVYNLKDLIIPEKDRLALVEGKTEEKKKKMKLKKSMQ